MRPVTPRWRDEAVHLCSCRGDSGPAEHRAHLGSDDVACPLQHCTRDTGKLRAMHTKAGGSMPRRQTVQEHQLLRCCRLLLGLGREVAAWAAPRCLFMQLPPRLASSCGLLPLNQHLHGQERQLRAARQEARLQHLAAGGKGGRGNVRPGMMRRRGARCALRSSACPPAQRALLPLYSCPEPLSCRHCSAALHACPATAAALPSVHL